MPSWEEIVNQVVIGSNYYHVEDASLQYMSLFDYLNDLHASLAQLQTSTRDSWKGPAADAFRQHLMGLAETVAELRDNHVRIATGFAACRDHLRTAVTSIPIPDWMYDEVDQRQRTYSQSGELWDNFFPPGTFAAKLYSELGHDAYGTGMDVVTGLPAVGGWMKSWEGFVTGFEDRAQTAYAELRTRYSGEYSNVPEGTPATPPGLGPGGYTPGGSYPGAGGLPPGAGAAFDPAPFGGLDPGAAAGFDPTGIGGPGADGAFDPQIPGTSLAGAGGGFGTPGGFGALGASAAGSPGLAGGVAGIGAGARIPGLGPAISPVTGGMGLPGMGGMGAGGVRAGGNRGRTSSIPTGRGSHGLDDGDDRTTWLDEDEDVRGTNSDAPPGVLGG